MKGMTMIKSLRKYDATEEVVAALYRSMRKKGVSMKKRDNMMYLWNRYMYKYI